MQDADAGARFSAVIVNYNGLNTLLDAVQSALREAIPSSQIIVVDNGSSDTSIAELEARAPDIRVVHNGCNAGFARAVNLGLHLLSSEFVLLLNNDAQLESGALKAFANTFDAAPKLAIAGGQLRYPNGRLQSAFAPLPTLIEELVPAILLKWLWPGRYRRTTKSTQTHEVESVFGACLVLRASTLPAIGLLDEEFFFYYEEVEWCHRARQAGLQVFYVPSARATHLWGHTANRFQGAARIELQRSKLIYFRKCSSPGTYLIVSAFLVFRALVNAIFGSLACVATLGLQRKVRVKTGIYWRIFAWHVTGRPLAWGLPGKCPQESAPHPLPF